MSHLDRALALIKQRRLDHRDRPTPAVSLGRRRALSPVVAATGRAAEAYLLGHPAAMLDALLDLAAYACATIEWLCAEAHTASIQEPPC